MKFNNTLSAILRGRWFLDKAWAESQLPVVISMLNGNPVSFVERSGYPNAEPFVLDQQMNRYGLYDRDKNWNRILNPNIPANSVGILPIAGPITKYNGDCGEPGNIQRSNWAIQMGNHPNIGSVIQLIDTPGGEAKAASGYLSALAKMGKPVISYIDGMCASLGMWISSASTEVYLSSELDEMGSIGTYCTLVDFRGYLEKEGIKLIEVYAPQSTEKNKNYRDALNGDTTAIEKDLEFLTSHFISFVKNSRSGKAANSIDTWNKGAIFYAKDAVRIGLADGIRPFDQVVSKAAWLAKRNK